jgi:hypothetical protein
LGVACFSDDYFREPYFRTLVAVHSSLDVLNGITATGQFLQTIMGSQPSTSLHAFPPALLAYTYQEWHRALRPGEILRTGIQHVPQAC